MEILILFLIFIVVFLLWRGARSAPFTPPSVSPISDQSLTAFEAAPSLWVNQAEATFFAILARKLPSGFHLHGKVRLEDIIRVKRNVNPKMRWSLRGRVKSRHIDYLVTDSTGRPVMAIELDGSSHDPKNPSEADKVKTALFEATSIPLHRVKVGSDFNHIIAIFVSELSAS